jgi:hypothetical protein
MAMGDLAAELRREGPMAEARMTERLSNHRLGNLHKFSGFDEIRALEQAYLPPEAQEKYEGGLGHRPDAPRG